MFCLECGAEMTVRARACPVCGHVYGDRERSLAESHPAQAAQRSLASGTTGAAAPPSQTTAAARYVGDLGTTGLPRDLSGRFVLGISLGLAADLLLPWVSVNNVNVTPASIGTPVVVVMALLAAATLPVFTTSLRQHPVWSALPLIMGAFCAGIAGSVWLLLAPLAQIFAVSFGSDPSNLALSPQTGLYLFLLGSAVLLVSGQRMLAATHASQLTETRRDAIRSLQSRQASAVVPATLAIPRPTAFDTDSAYPPVARQAEVPISSSPAETPVAPASPAAPNAPVVPVLPGSDAWHQATAAPSPLRPAPGGGWGKSRNPHRLR